MKYVLRVLLGHILCTHSLALSAQIPASQPSLWLYPALTSNWLQADLNAGLLLRYGPPGPGGGITIGGNPDKQILTAGFYGGMARTIVQNPDLPVRTDPATNTAITPSRYVETTLFQTGVSLKINFWRSHRISPYLLSGGQIQFYFSKDQNGIPLVLDRSTRPASEASYPAGTLSFPVGTGLDLQVSPGLHLFTEYSLRFFATDFLDNIASLGSRVGNDRMHSLAIGIGIPLNPTTAPAPRPWPPVLPADTLIATIPLPATDSLVDTLQHELVFRPDIQQDSCDTMACIQFVLETVADSSPPRPDSVYIARAEADSVAAQLTQTLAMNIVLQERIALLEAQLARQQEDKETLVANLAQKAAENDRLREDSLRQRAAIREALDMREGLLSQQQQQAQACAEAKQMLADSLLLLRTALKSAQQQTTTASVAAEQNRAAESQLLNNRIAIAEQKLAELKQEELKFKQLQQRAVFLVSQGEASAAEEVMAIPVPAEEREQPAAKALQALAYSPEKMADGAMVYFGVMLNGVSASPLRLRLHPVRLPGGQWAVLLTARRSTDGVWLSPATTPTEAEALIRWFQSCYP